MVRTSGVGRYDHKSAGILSTEPRTSFLETLKIALDAATSGSAGWLWAVSTAVNRSRAVASFISTVLWHCKPIGNRPLSSAAHQRRCVESVFEIPTLIPIPHHRILSLGLAVCSTMNCRYG